MASSETARWSWRRVGDETWLGMALAALPLLLSIHGFLVLRLLEPEPWQQVVVALVGVSGLAGLAALRSVRARWIVRIQLVLLLAAAGALILSTGGAQSFFLLWLFAIAAVYPETLPEAGGLTLSILIAGFYALTPVLRPSTLSLTILVSRVFLLLVIGLLGTSVAASTERAGRADRRFRRLVESASDGIVAIDGNRRIVLVNEQLEDLFGYDRNDLLGRPLAVLLPERFREGDDRLVDGFITAPEDRRPMSTRPELRARRADGSEFPVEISISHSTQDSDIAATAIIRDVTERRRTEEALREREAELEQLVSTKDDLIASVSHEIRTPLTGIVGYARILYEEESDLTDEEQRSMIEAMVHQSADLTHIVEDLLVAARAEIGALEVAHLPVDLHSEARTVIENWAPADLEDIAISGPSVDCVGDPARVRQIIRNLIGNALRYGGNTIRIEVGDADGAGFVHVIDDGNGLPQGTEDDVFEPYERAHEIPGVTPALGLGLPISRSLARRMDGDLVYERNRGETSFSLMLPLQTATQPISPTSGATN